MCVCAATVELRSRAADGALRCVVLLTLLMVCRTLSRRRWTGDWLPSRMAWPTAKAGGWLQDWCVYPDEWVDCAMATPSSLASTPSSFDCCCGWCCCVVGARAFAFLVALAGDGSTLTRGVCRRNGTLPYGSHYWGCTGIRGPATRVGFFALLGMPTWPLPHWPCNVGHTCTTTCAFPFHLPPAHDGRPFSLSLTRVGLTVFVYIARTIARHCDDRSHNVLAHRSCHGS